MIKIRDYIPKVILLSDYEDMVLYQVEILKENAELRKVCQCGECKWLDEDGMCTNWKSDNSNDRMNPYGSCKECERR